MTVYHISHITDLMNIPEDRLDACLSELGVALRFMRVTANTATQNGDPRVVSAMFPTVRWDDNGDKAVTVTNDGKTIIELRSQSEAGV